MHYAHLTYNQQHASRERGRTLIYSYVCRSRAARRLVYCRRRAKTNSLLKFHNPFISIYLFIHARVRVRPSRLPRTYTYTKHGLNAVNALRQFRTPGGKHRYSLTKIFQSSSKFEIVVKMLTYLYCAILLCGSVYPPGIELGTSHRAEQILKYSQIKTTM